MTQNPYSVAELADGGSWMSPSLRHVLFWNEQRWCTDPKPFPNCRHSNTCTLEHAKFQSMNLKTAASWKLIIELAETLGFNFQRDAEGSFIHTMARLL
jgi:hypothetical protein